MDDESAGWAALLDEAYAAALDAAKCLISVITECDARGLWRASGAPSAAHWIAVRTGVPLPAAEAWLRAARLLRGREHGRAGYSSSRMSRPL